MMKIQINEIIKLAGSQGKLASSVGLSQQAISRWVKNDKIPAEHVWRVSEILGLPPEKIRPDIFRKPIQEPAE